MNSKQKFLFLVVSISLIAFLLSGCATVLRKEEVASVNINGVSYYPLLPLCKLRNVNLQYDTFSRSAILTRDNHRVNLMVGDTLVLVDGSPQYLRHPVDMYQGQVVVPGRFKEQILDVVFAGYAKPSEVRITGIKRIVVDAGHGGNDPGAMGRSGVREKDINLDIAQRLALLLRNQGVDVIMTRTTDTFIPLSRRVDITNRAKADLFVSIHSNANRVRSLNGLEIYYISPAANDTKRAQLAARSSTPYIGNTPVASGSFDLRATLWDMIYTYNRGQSILLARKICDSINDELDTRVIGVKNANFYVLKGARTPAILVEVGFVSSPTEERMLRNSYYRQKLAEGILRGIGQYSRQVAITEGQK